MDGTGIMGGILGPSLESTHKRRVSPSASNCACCRTSKVNQKLSRIVFFWRFFFELYFPGQKQPAFGFTAILLLHWVTKRLWLLSFNQTGDRQGEAAGKQGSYFSETFGTREAPSPSSFWIWPSRSCSPGSALPSSFPATTTRSPSCPRYQSYLKFPKNQRDTYVYPCRTNFKSEKKKQKL